MSRLAEALARDDMTSLEEAWIEEIGNGLDDLSPFLRTLDVLDRRQEMDSIEPLLELLDDELQAAGAWDHRLTLLQRAGKHYLRQGHIHETVMSTVEKLYEGREEQLEILLPAVGLGGGRDETPKLWDKVVRLQNLLRYEVGTIVAMKDRGVGKVVDINLPLQTLKVDLENQKGVSVGFRAAGTMLETLEPEHVLYRKAVAPDELNSLEPSELLREVLTCYEEPLPGSEVRKVVAGLIDAKKWSSWWTKARKHPQVIVHDTKPQTYSWADSGEEARDSLWSSFEGGDLGAQLDLLRRANRQHDELRSQMANALSASGEGLADSDLPASITVFTALERAGFEPEWDVVQRLADHSRPVDLLGKVTDRAARERALDWVRQRPDWMEHFTEQFSREDDQRCLNKIAEALAKQGADALNAAIERILVQPRESPAAFAFLADRATEDTSFREHDGVRLFRRLLQALDDEAFAKEKARLALHADTGGLLPKLLQELEPGEALGAKQALEGSRELESYRRDALLTSLHLRFPDLEEEKEQPLYALAESLTAKREELRVLLEEEIPENRRAIETAREMGDLRENFEYKSARARHEYLTVRAEKLNQQIKRAKVLDPATVDTGQIRVGTRIALGKKGTPSRTLRILGPWESDPDAGIISYESELARSLLGKKKGESIEIEGEPLEVLEISQL